LPARVATSPLKAAWIASASGHRGQPEGHSRVLEVADGLVDRGDEDLDSAGKRRSQRESIRSRRASKAAIHGRACASAR
jgi:hypothetical protein